MNRHRDHPEPIGVVWDIETGPLPPDKLRIPKLKPPANLKDPAKIEAALAEKREAYIANAALSAQSGMILLVGLLFIGEKQTAFLSGDEAKVLKEFWDLWRLTFAKPWWGHNARRFDAPFVIRRSWILGVEVPSDALEHGRPSPRFCDTMEKWNLGSEKTEAGSSSLEAIGGCFGVEKYGGGENFHLVYDADPDEGIAHCRRDLEMTLAIGQGMGAIPKAAQEVDQ